MTSDIGQSLREYIDSSAAAIEIDEVKAPCVIALEPAPKARPLAWRIIPVAACLLLAIGAATALRVDRRPDAVVDSATSPSASSVLSSTSTAPTASPTTAFAGPANYPTTPEQWDAFAATHNPSVRLVPRDEYAAAATTATNCLRSHGVAAGAPTPSASGRFIRLTVPDGAPAATVDACRSPFRSVEDAWTKRTMVTFAEWQELMAQRDECLQTAGASPGASGPSGTLPGTDGSPAAVAECHARYGDVLAAPPTWPY